MSEIAHLDQAKALLVAARSFVEVMSVRVLADSEATKAREAGNRALEIDWTELFMRSERRLGEIINASRRAQEAFIARGRKLFRPGRRQRCHICGKFRYVAEAHHVVPLAEQFNRGFASPDHEHVWLCPTHHAIIHVLIDGNPPLEVRGRRFAAVLVEIDEAQLEKIMDLIARSARMPA